MIEKKWIAVIGYPALLLSCLLGAAKAQVPTNLQVLDSALVQPVIARLDSLPERVENVQLVLKNQSGLGEWAVQKIQEKLLDRRIAVYDSFPDELQNKYTVVINQMQASIQYRVKKRNLLFRASKYERTISFILSFYIKNKNESILYSNSKNFDYQDVISKSEMKKLENDGYPFTAGSKAESKLMKRIFEPVLVTVTTAGVVYLFYTLRSGS